jgi:protein phosphatase
MLDVIFGEATDAGKVRPNNEDAMVSFRPASRRKARSHGWMFAVADGVGGAGFGEVAAATAVSVLAKGFPEAQEDTALVALMPRLVQQANAEVHNAALTPERRGSGMASTLVCCGLRNDQAVVSHVGDSRCYLIRKGEAQLMTRDHTWVNEQRKLGLITAAEAQASEARHVLVKCLGPELFVSCDTAAFRVEPGDTLVLCSDGLHGALGDGEIAEFITKNGARNNMQQVAEELVAHAVNLDGSDNTTAQIIRIRSVEQVGMYRGRTYRIP